MRRYAQIEEAYELPNMMARYPVLPDEDPFSSFECINVVVDPTDAAKPI